MVRTVNVNMEIPANRELHIVLPSDFPVGPADIVLVVSPSPSQTSTLPTVGNLADSEFIGMWKDRSDITDGVEFARNLRAEGWKRPA